MWRMLKKIVLTEWKQEIISSPNWIQNNSSHWWHGPWSTQGIMKEKSQDNGLTINKGKLTNENSNIQVLKYALRTIQIWKSEVC